MSEEDDAFLSPQQMKRLTGRSQRQTQIDQLKAQLIPFHINARGWPVVARAVVEGRASNEEKPKAEWRPRVLEKAA